MEKDFSFTTLSLERDAPDVENKASLESFI